MLRSPHSIRAWRRSLRNRQPAGAATQHLCRGGACPAESSARRALVEFQYFEARGSFPSARKVTEGRRFRQNTCIFRIKCRAIGQKCRFCVGQIVVLPFVFMHIPGGSFIFNISSCALPLCDFCPLCLGVCGSATRSGATLRCARLALHRIVEAAEGTKPERSLACTPHLCFRPAV